MIFITSIIIFSVSARTIALLWSGWTSLPCVSSYSGFKSYRLVRVPKSVLRLGSDFEFCFYRSNAIWQFVCSGVHLNWTWHPRLLLAATLSPLHLRETFERWKAEEDWFDSPILFPISSHTCKRAIMLFIAESITVAQHRRRTGDNKYFMLSVINLYICPC